MKTLTIQYLVTAILFFTGPVIYPQSDSVLTYYPDDISIEYESGFRQSTNWETGKISSVPSYQLIENIQKLRFIDDSSVNISNDIISDLQLNINNIKEVSIRSGSNTGSGILIGALSGLGLGVLIGAAIGSTYNTGSSGLGSIGTPIGGMVGSGIGIILGGVVGGILGANSSSYETFDMNKFNFDKKKNLERILKYDRKENSR